MENVDILMQDHKSLHAAFTICNTLVNTHTDCYNVNSDLRGNKCNTLYQTETLADLNQFFFTIFYQFFNWSKCCLQL